MSSRKTRNKKLIGFDKDLQDWLSKHTTLYANTCEVGSTPKMENKELGTELQEMIKTELRKALNVFVGSANTQEEQDAVVKRALKIVQDLVNKIPKEE